MLPSVTKHPIWFWISTVMHYIFLKPRLAAGPVVIVFWAGYPKTKNHQAQWSHLHFMQCAQMGCSIRSGGRIWSTISQLQRRKSDPQYPPWHGTPTTCYPGTLRQCYSSWNNKWYCKAPQVKINWDVFFLGKRPSKARTFCHLLAPRIRTFGRLSVKTPHRQASP